MKKLYFLLSLLMLQFASAQIINFPDSGFKQRLLAASPSYHVAKNLTGSWVDIDANGDNEIQVSEALQISYLDVDGFMVTIVSIDGIAYFSNLEELKIQSIDGTALNISGFANLQTLTISNNDFLSAVNLSSLNNLKTLAVDNNEVLAALDVSAFTGLTSLNCNYNALTSLDLANLNNLVNLVCYFESISTLDLNGMVNLETLDCSYLDLTSLDLTGLVNIKKLNCFANSITALDVSAMTQLQDLNCGATLIAELNLQNAPNLKSLFISNTELTNLDLSVNVNLKSLYCSYNPALIVDLSPLVNLETLEYVDSDLIQLDISACTKLKTLKCHSNNFVTLDLTNQFQLETLEAHFCPLLVSIFAKNGSHETISSLPGCPALTYICLDDEDVAALQSNLNSWGFTNIVCNSYCSFVPGGTFYDITGHSRLDTDLNGCSETDVNYPYMRLSIADGVTTGGVISDELGVFSVPVQAGTHTLSPNLENPTYFNFSPASVSVAFPETASPSVQDFCVVANGIHPDLDIVIIPIGPARPGFDADYKILLRNKGTHTQSGSVNLTFNDEAIDLITSMPVASVGEGLLTWDFTDLYPFETRVIELTFNLNSPSETPALNVNDVLSFMATISGDPADEIPIDNVFALRQTIVNSLDPNDKTCLEGNSVGPEMAGEYVHYVIRFENTGTFPAQNIVVKDMIDTTKFDIASLIPLGGSHSYYTRISGNKVEFIFENINLPFDDANNDGYVVFKIKTKPTLTMGSTFSNTASIYFDYNSPIVTNTATTAIALLAVKDFEFSDCFTVYPNPASNVLNIQTKGNIAVTSIEIYNTLGQLVLAIPNAGKIPAVDVSQLKSGNYFIKINSDKGSSNSKFIKR
ncbi:MAG TPA: T9SS type A sorting domain-containing protein [Flavobacterium sp.]|nr:T9SS type A sorting domain-containing protein [Flavobacterium sp.]